MIKVVQTKDYILLAKLNEEIQTIHHNIQPTIFKPYDKEAITHFFKKTLDNENVVAYVVTDNETILGYVLLFIINCEDNAFQYSRSFILLDQILVLKNYQRKGVGKLLLDKIFSFAKEKNIGFVEVNHWTLNDSARNFFAKNKFEYYNEKMWRTIN